MGEGREYKQEADDLRIVILGGIELHRTRVESN
jgi:hypothetical protein